MKLLVLALLAGMLAGILPAGAALTLCNRTSTILYAATAAQQGSDANVQGWTRIVPGACEIARKEALSAPAYFVYARSSLAYAGPARAWGGNISLCVKDADFSAHESLTGARCSEDMFPLPFARLNTSALHDWTMTFDEALPFARLTDAQLVGVKRLLADNGFHVGEMDTHPNPATGAALGTFRKRLRFPPEANNDQLFSALETEALKTNAPAGYTVCNDSDATFDVALAQTSGGKSVSQGWWTIPPGGCAKTLTTPLHDDMIYLLAQSRNGKVIAGGAQTFCITAIPFEIEGRKNCSARGLSNAGFATTHTQGVAGYVAHVGGNGVIPPLSHAAGAHR